MDQQKKNILMGGGLAVALVFLVCTKTDLPQKVTGLFHKDDAVAAMPAKRAKPSAAPTLPGASSSSSAGAQSGTAAGAQDNAAQAAQGDAAPAEDAGASADSGSALSFPADDINARISDAVVASQRIMTQVQVGTAEAEAQAAREQRAAELARQGKKPDEKVVISPYQGAWRGTYTGFDSGRILVNVDKDGLVTGSGLSEKTGVGFDIKGKIAEDGAVELTKDVAGAAADAVPFKGTFAADTGSGTWSGGTWQAQRSASR